MLVTNLLIRLLGQPGASHDQGRQHDFNCPNCAEIYNGGRPDNRFNLGVNLALPKGGELIRVYNCWKCGTKGELGTLFRRWGGQDWYEQYQGVASGSEFALRVVKKETFKRKLYLPDEYVPFFGPQVDYKAPERAIALGYLATRGIPEKTIRQFRLGYAQEGRYAQRIIMPSFDRNGELNYFVGRTYVDHPEKYRNPTVDKKTIIFNESNINWDLPVTLTEGPFEVLAYGHNNIPLLGKAMYPLLMEKILVNNARIILGLNLDAFEEKIIKGEKLGNKSASGAASTKGIYKMLLDAGLKYVRWWKFPENDLAKTLQLWGEERIFSSLASDLLEIEFHHR